MELLQEPWAARPKHRALATPLATPFSLPHLEGFN